MTAQKVDCRACESEFTVDVDQNEARCASCGTKYAAPWDDPELLSSPVRGVADGGTPRSDGGGASSRQAADSDESEQPDREQTLSLEGPATVRITIEIDPR